MLNYLPSIFSFVWDQITSVWSLYTTCSVLSGFFVLWVLDRMFHIFDILKR